MTVEIAGSTWQGRRSPDIYMIQNALLLPQQVDANLCVSSRKKLFQVFSEMLSETVCAQTEATDNCSADQINNAADEVFQTLNDREKLGSTGLGKGIALPHGRLQGLAEPIIAIARLQTPISYDAPDGQPIWLAVCLIAPEQAHDIHLQLLGALATKFSDEGFLSMVKSAEGDQMLYELFQQS